VCRLASKAGCARCDVGRERVGCCVGRVSCILCCFTATATTTHTPLDTSLAAAGSCRATTGSGKVVVVEETLALRASYTPAPAFSQRALTHTAAAWPAAAPHAPAHASGLICDRLFMSSRGLLSGPRPAVDKGSCASGMIAGVRDKLCDWFLMVRFLKVLIGRHAEAVARLNCRLSVMVIHKNLGVLIYCILLRFRYGRFGVELECTKRSDVVSTSCSCTWRFFSNPAEVAAILYTVCSGLQLQHTSYRINRKERPNGERMANG